MKLGVISLGCDKATVDSERLVGDLVGHGATLTDDLPHADVILVNTCGFIDAAKRESIDAILEAAKLKQPGGVKAVVAVGCLVQRYKTELQEEMPEAKIAMTIVTANSRKIRSPHSPSVGCWPIPSRRIPASASSSAARTTCAT